MNDQSGRTPTETNDADEEITTSLQIPCICGEFRGNLGATRGLFSPFLKTSLAPIGFGRNLICRDFPMRFGEVGAKTRGLRDNLLGLGMEPIEIPSKPGLI